MSVITEVDPNQPYSQLTPDLILSAIESVGYVCNGSLFALNSFENRVYQIGLDDGTFIIAKFYRPNRWTSAAIQEEHDFSHELVAHEIPIVPPLIASSGNSLHHYQDFRFALFVRSGGRVLELENQDNIEWMGRFIGRLHAVGASKKFQHRMQLNADTYGYQPYKFLIDNNIIPNECKSEYQKIMANLLQKIDERYKAVGSIEMIRLHGDCHPGNILWNDNGPKVVDLDDCLEGPAIQDLWMMLSGETPKENRTQFNRILHGYHEFYDFNPREFHLVEALRALRMIHYSAWLAKRWDDPAFPINFPWFNTVRYWQEQMANLQDQVDLLEDNDFLFD